MTGEPSEAVAYEGPDAEMWLYHSFMEELKVRLSAMRGMLEELSGTQSSHAFIVAESCYLQLRYVCELIALASLAIHYNVETSKKLLASYSPQKTFEELLRSNKDAFPRAINLHDKEGAFHFDFAPERDITAEELYRTYGACGEALHRGTLKNIIAGKPKSYNLADLDTWLARIANFLHQHTILLDGHQNVFVAHLTGGTEDAVLVQRGNLQDN